MSFDSILAELAEWALKDVEPTKGRSFGLVYQYNEEINRLNEKIFQLYQRKNAVSASTFPSIAMLEKKTLTFCKQILGFAPSSAGCVTSCSTESNYLALRAFREKAKVERNISHPSILASASAHPSLFKAAYDLSMPVIKVPMDAAYKMPSDPEILRQYLREDTCILVASCPTYSHGVHDPIAVLAAFSLEHQLSFHIDAAIGGLYFPFEKAGPLAAGLTALEGVSSITIDLHKYGYAPRGISVLLYKEKAMRHYQYFYDPNYLGNSYIAPTFLGSREAYPLACAYAIIRYLGVAGFQAAVQSIERVRERLYSYIKASSYYAIVGQPEASIICITSTVVDIHALYKALLQKGWFVSRLSTPLCLHLILMPIHEISLAEFIADLESLAQSLPRATKTTELETCFVYGLKAQPGTDPMALMDARYDES